MLKILQYAATHASRFVHQDESGYSIIVTTTFADGQGWNAHVEFRTFGRKTEAGAVEDLIPALQHGLRLLQEQDND